MKLTKELEGSYVKIVRSFDGETESHVFIGMLLFDEEGFVKIIDDDGKATSCYWLSDKYTIVGDVKIEVLGDAFYRWRNIHA